MIAVAALALVAWQLVVQAESSTRSGSSGTDPDENSGVRLSAAKDPLESPSFNTRGWKTDFSRRTVPLHEIQQSLAEGRLTMEAVGSMALAFGAGVLTVTSPCILPILPAVLGLTATQSRGRVLLVAAGLATGFTALGTSISLFGSLLGQDSNTVRLFGGAMLFGFGLLMLVPAWQHRLLGRVHLELPSSSGSSAWSAFLTGLLLGVTWIPCAGPVLGSISALVFSQADVGLGAAMFFVYAVGVVLPMIGVAYAGNRVLLRGLMKRQAGITRFAGSLVALAGLLVLTGLDREAQNLIQQFYSGWVI